MTHEPLSITKGLSYLVEWNRTYLAPHTVVLVITRFFVNFVAPVGFIMAPYMVLLRC